MRYVIDRGAVTVDVYLDTIVEAGWLGYYFGRLIGEGKTTQKWYIHYYDMKYAPESSKIVGTSSASEVAYLIINDIQQENERESDALID